MSVLSNLHQLCFWSTFSMVLFLSIGLYIYATRVYVGLQITAACDGATNILGTPIVEGVETAYTEFDKFYCTTDCRCKAAWEPVPVNRVFSPFDPTSVSNVTGCPEMVDLLAEDPIKPMIGFDEIGGEGLSSIIEYISAVETDNKCSGLCTKKDVYYFGDVNLGPPETDCQIAILDSVITTFYGAYGQCMLSIGISFFIIWYI